MSKYKAKKKDTPKVKGREKQRSWGGRLKGNEVRDEFCSRRQVSQMEVISAEEEVDLRERLALLHQSYFQTKDLIPISLEKLGIENASALRTAFQNYDEVRAKEGKRVFAATTRPLAILLGIKN